MSGALSEAEATRIASAWLGSPEARKEHDGKRNAVAAAADWLAGHGPDLEAALLPLMPGLLTDGMYIGAYSAQAVTAGTLVAKAKKPAGMNPAAGWKPGDTANAGSFLDRLGFKGPDPAAVKDAAGKVSGGALGALGRVLVEGMQASADARSLAERLAAAAADKAKATAAALDQVTRQSALAAGYWYRDVGVEYVEWLTEEDGRVCPVCGANQDEGAVKLGEPFESGDDSPPAHFRCRCVLLPAAGHEAPGQPEPQPPAEPGESEPEEAAAPEPEPPAEPEQPAEPEEPEPVQFARELAEAWQAGHAIGGQLEGGGQGGVARAALSDGTRVVVKQHQSPQEAVHEYLAGLVARALGIDDAGAALTGDTETIAKLVPGSPGGRLIGDAWFHDGITDKAAGEAELQRQMGLRNGREIGLLDWLTDNWDRNGGNWITGHDAVRPVDHAAAWSEMDPGQPNTISSPFTRHWLGTDPGSFTSPFSRAELDQFRAGMEALKPEFTAHGAATEYGFMMDRLSTVEAVAS